MEVDGWLQFLLVLFIRSLHSTLATPTARSPGSPRSPLAGVDTHCHCTGMSTGSNSHGDWAGSRGRGLYLSCIGAGCCNDADGRPHAAKRSRGLHLNQAQGSGAYLHIRSSLSIAVLKATNISSYWSSKITPQKYIMWDVLYRVVDECECCFTRQLCCWCFYCITQIPAVILTQLGLLSK